MSITETLNDKISHFYDRSTQLWLDTWGEHMHHGYYGPDGEETKDHRQAQLDLVDELLDWGRVERAGRILDAGCGVGGSARLLAGRFGATVDGLTLSPVQAERAAEFNRRAGLQDRVHIHTRDLMTLTRDDGPYDLVWSLESAEHIADKGAMLRNFYDVLRPGGAFVMATWCHRHEPPVLSQPEEQLLGNIYRRYHLPPMISLPVYENLAREAGFRQVQSADWSPAVAPFWQAVIRSAFTWQGVRGLLRAGGPAIRGAWAMRYMTRGYDRGLIQFGLLQGRKL